MVSRGDTQKKESKLTRREEHGGNQKTLKSKTLQNVLLSWSTESLLIASSKVSSVHTWMSSDFFTSVPEIPNWRSNIGPDKTKRPDTQRTQEKASCEGWWERSETASLCQQTTEHPLLGGTWRPKSSLTFLKWQADSVLLYSFSKDFDAGKRIWRKSPWWTAALSPTTVSSSGSPPNCKTFSLSSKNLTLAV